MITTGKYFEKLPMDLKALYVLRYGTFLISKEYEEMIISLYSFDDLYVELWEDSVEIVHVKSYHDNRCLSKYLNDIDVTHALS